TQHEGVDFFQTFSPVVGYDTLQTVLSVAAYRGWTINALDFTQTYLNATLKEDVWLELPDGEIVKANKAIYGFKQSAMEWYKELRGTILAEGWGSSAYDECLYYRESNDGRIATLTTYVDDTLFTGDFTEEIGRMCKRLLEIYEGRDLGTPDKLVGVRITIRKDGITPDQALYAQGIARRRGGTGHHTVSVRQHPRQANVFGRDDSPRLGQQCSRTGATGSLSMPAALTRAKTRSSLRHLYTGPRTTMSRNDRQVLVGYADSDWGTDPETRRSVTGYLLLVNNSPVAWRSKLQ
ncbi:unnamed protein product, partial [Discosporangium mesarthrocarpum]